jgi:hypothetical protein
MGEHGRRILIDAGDDARRFRLVGERAEVAQLVPGAPDG